MKKNIILSALVIFFLSGCEDFDPLSLINEDEKSVYSYFSKALVTPEEARIIVDNDESFFSKLDIIANSKNSLKLNYYIFSDDTSSSYFVREVIKAAQRGVKVEILLDLHTEYKNLEYFAMLMEQGGGNIDIRFYGRPGREFMKDVVYLTSTCSKELSGKDGCDEAKQEKISFLFSRDRQEEKDLGISDINTGFSGQFLSGFYAKDLSLLAVSVIAGQRIDLEKFKKGVQLSPEEKLQLKELGFVAWKAYFSSNIFVKLLNKIQLNIALLVYKEQINPIHRMFKEYLPLSAEYNQKRLKEWSHVTDFMHHKLLIADGTYMQLGGRNIENSYHMKANKQAKKYIFMDTDVYVEAKQGGLQVEKTFNDLFSYRSLVATLPQVRAFAPNDSYLQKKYAKKFCLDKGIKKVEKDSFKGCIESVPRFSVKKYRKGLYQELLKRAKKYEQYRPGTSHPLVEKHINSLRGSSKLSISKDAQMYYVENVPYVLNEEGVPGQRIFATELKKDTFKAKGIHGIWAYELLRSCVVSQKEKRNINIYMNSAYFFPAGQLLSVMGRMIDGTLDCHRVTVHILTNSIKTTDLYPINSAANFLLTAFFSSLRNKNIREYGLKKQANFKFYEYAEMQPDKESKAASLHSKVMVFDKSIYVGSANFDTRSLVMDTNNGFHIVGDLDLVNRYKKILKEMIRDGAIVEKANLLSQASPFYTRDISIWIAGTYSKIEPKLKSLGWSKKRLDLAKKTFFSVAQSIYKSSEKILFGEPRFEFDLESNEIIGVTFDKKALKFFNLLTKEI